MNAITSLISGLLFGLGLLISGMANPSKVIGFLDIFGCWDPSLSFVMLGAISVSALGVLLAKQRGKSWFGVPISLPDNKQIDYRLIVGSALFGMGWGIAGVCPGPVLVALNVAFPDAGIFVLSMLAGMLLHKKLYSKS